jgi:hypothetical protein
VLLKLSLLGLLSNEEFTRHLPPYSNSHAAIDIAIVNGKTVACISLS